MISETVQFHLSLVPHAGMHSPNSLYALSRQYAAAKARIKFDLPEYLEPVLKELLVEHWNESGEYADHVLGGVI